MIYRILLQQFDVVNENGMIYTADTEFNFNLSALTPQVAAIMDAEPSEISDIEIIKAEDGLYVNFCVAEIDGVGGNENTLSNGA